jgi:hypothetical protein
VDCGPRVTPDGLPLPSAPGLVLARHVGPQSDPVDVFDRAALGLEADEGVGEAGNRRPGCQIQETSASLGYRTESLQTLRWREMDSKFESPSMFGY